MDQQSQSSQGIENQVNNTSSLPNNSTQSSPPLPQTPPIEPPHKKNSSFVIIIIILSIFIGGLLLAGWYFQSQLQKANSETHSSTPTTSQIKKLIVGTDPTFQPMEYMEKGKYLGYDIDLAYFLAKELGAQVEFKNIPFDNLFTALEQKKIDMVISGITITDERKQKYDFSELYLNVGQVIITRKTTDNIKTTKDLQGKKIAVQQGTTNETEALLHTSPNLVVRYPDFVQATKSLVDGQVDAIFSDLPASKGIVTENPTLKIASDPFTNEYYGIVFRKGDPRVKQINNALEAIRIKGILTDLKQKWLD